LTLLAAGVAVLLRLCASLMWDARWLQDAAGLITAGARACITMTAAAAGMWSGLFSWARKRLCA
jgi:hypothetical protein